MRKWIYGIGCLEGNEKIYLKRYNDHNKEVVEYFKDRPNDFLIMDFSNGDGWEKLCPFLGCDIPKIDFPHVNKAGNRKWKILRRRSRKYRRRIIGRSEK